MYFLIWSPNLVFVNTRITAKRAVAGENLPKIFGHARSQDLLYAIVNQEGTTDVILSGVITQDTNPPQPTFHIIVWRLKGERTERLNFHLFVDKIKYFMLLTIIKILLFGNLQEWNQLLYLSMNQTHVMVVYSLIKNITIDYVFSIKLIQIPIC